jgi:gamma-glutamylputrescine oxidase
LEEVIDAHGLPLTRAIWDDIETTRARVAQMIDSAPDACDNQMGVVVAAMNQVHLDYAHSNLEVLRRDFDYHGARPLNRREILGYVNSPDFIGGMIYEDARHINPLKFIRHLAGQTEAAGAKIFEQSPVIAIKKQGQDSELSTPNGKITARHVVVAAGANFRRPHGLSLHDIGQRFIPTQTVILATEVLPPDVLRRAMPGKAAIFDGRSFLNYMRPMADGRILFGGLDAITDYFTESSARELEKVMFRVLPTLAADGVKVEHWWSGHVDPTRNLLPSVRRVSDGLYEALGFSGQGHVMTVLAGEAIAEDIMTGHSERLARLARLAPPDFLPSVTLGKLQLGVEWGPTLLSEKLFCPQGAGAKLDKTLA